MPIQQKTLLLGDPGDPTFMSKVFVNYHGMMKQIAFKVVKDEKAAEDIVQNTFVKLIEHISTIRKLNDKTLTTYIIKTVQHQSLNYLKAKYTLVNTYYTLQIDDFLMVLKDETTDIENTIVSKIAFEEFQHRLTKLPPKYSEALQLKYMLGKTDTEIAEHLGIGKDSVRMCLKRAKQKASELVKDIYP